MASLLRRSCSLAPARRAFSTSTPRLGSSLQWDSNNREALAEVVPEYPYGSPQWYKQSRRGLYGEQRIRFGNNVSVKGKNKSRRSWRPNIMMKRLFSKSLNRHVQVKVSSRVLRTMDKLGGLDEYLLGEKETRIRELGESGWWLRWAIMQTNSVKNRFAAERAALGLPTNTEELRIEEEDAEATLAASIADAEVAELTLEEADPNVEAEPMVQDVLAEDDVFQVEQSKDLPPLRFRVARNKYIMLTEQGWRSLTPADSVQQAAERAAKQKIRENLKDVKDALLATNIEHLQQELASMQLEYKVEQAEGTAATTETRPLSEEEKEALYSEAQAALRREVKKKIEAQVQKAYDAPMKGLQAMKERKRLLKAAQKDENTIVASPSEVPV